MENSTKIKRTQEKQQQQNGETATRREKNEEIIRCAKKHATTATTNTHSRRPIQSFSLSRKRASERARAYAHIHRRIAHTWVENGKLFGVICCASSLTWTHLVCERARSVIPQTHTVSRSLFRSVTSLFRLAAGSRSISHSFLALLYLSIRTVLCVFARLHSIHMNVLSMNFVRQQTFPTWKHMATLYRNYTLYTHAIHIHGSYVFRLAAAVEVFLLLFCFVWPDTGFIRQYMSSACVK